MGCLPPFSTGDSDFAGPSDRHGAWAPLLLKDTAILRVGGLELRGTAAAGDVLEKWMSPVILLYSAW